MSKLEYPKAVVADELPAIVAAQLSRAKADGAVVVLVTGVFDLFHTEHQQFLQKAKAQGDFLLVGLESDARVTALKGADRPIQSEHQRWQQVQDFAAVDAAFVLPDDFSNPTHHRGLIAAVQPNCLAVSSHSPHQDKKQAILQLYGGEVVVVHEHNPSISTSLLVEQRD